MKILQVCNHFYPYMGGTEQVVFYLSRELVKRGHKVKIICADEPKVGDLEIDNIEVRRLPYITKISNTNITLSLYKEICCENFDILHTHLPHPWNASISSIVSLLRNKPLFLTYHNDIVGKGLNSFIAHCYNITALKLLLYRSRKIFIAHKNYFKWSPFLKAFRDKVTVAPPGVDGDKFRPIPHIYTRTEKNIIFFVSILDKLHIYKGLEYLLLSIKKISAKIPIKLYIGGKGDLEDYYKKIVRVNGLEEIVHFLGFLPDEELNRYYNICDIFVLPSISVAQEGFGLVALEAMACGKPVIVTDITGVADVVKKEKTGIVVKPKNIDELMGALIFMFSNEKERKTMGDNAYRCVKEKYTCEKQADIIEQEYLEVINKKRL